MVSEVMNLKIYPSGFLGNATVLQTELPDTIHIAKRIFDNSPETVASKYTASQEICDLWQLYVSGDKFVKTFEFKEKVLKVALKAFGTTTLLEWITIQQNSAHYSDSQARWIDDTLQYVYDDKLRTINHSSWRTVLKMGSGSNAMNRTSVVVKKILMNGSLLSPTYNPTIEKFIISWCKKRGGFYDLLAHLNVLFGTR